MAKEAEAGESQARRWPKAAWVAVAALIMLPLLAFCVTGLPPSVSM